MDETVEQLTEWYQGKISKSRLVEGAYKGTDFFPKIGTAGKWLYFTAAPIRNAKGVIIGAVETLEDLTERKRINFTRHDSLLNEGSGVLLHLSGSSGQ